jgi:hypothetical protein
VDFKLLSKIILLISILILFNFSTGYTWDPATTHDRLTVSADTFLINKGILLPPSALTNLENGAKNEDNRLYRSWFHYSPPLNGFELPEYATCDSLQWAFNEVQCTAISWTCFADSEWGNCRPLPTTRTLNNEFGWMDAIDKKNTDAGWTALGHVLHLLQDLAVPDHARRDPHPTQQLWGLEAYAKSNTPPQPSSSESLIDVNPKLLFNILSGYTRENFFSASTCFDPSLPGPTSAREDFNYYYDSTGRKIAYKGITYKYYLYKYWISDPRLATINDTIATEQFNKLAPQAILYTASLIKHYYDLTNPSIATLGDHIMSDGTGANWGGCFTPNEKYTFFPTDPFALLYVKISNVPRNFTLGYAFYKPDGTLYSGVTAPFSNWGYDYLCLIPQLQIAGHPPASIPGKWRAYYSYNDGTTNFSGSEYFKILPP